jgi:ABC-2 type transport system ATP-binding protein
LRAWTDVSFDIEAGEFFGLLGPNGAGKTTLISVLAGLVRATGGRVTVMGHDVVADYAAARKSLGIVPQELVFDPFFSVRETLRIQSGYFGVKNNDAWIDELLGDLGLSDKAECQHAAALRRHEAARAGGAGPGAPAAGHRAGRAHGRRRRRVAPDAVAFIARLNREGHTVLLTTHYLEEAEALCGRIGMLKQGRASGGAGPHQQPAGRARPAPCCASRPTRRCRGRTGWTGARHRAHRAGQGARRGRGRADAGRLREPRCRSKTWRSAAPTWRTCS